MATALKATDEARVEWDEVDLRYRGKGVEVKASAYLQSWRDEASSRVSFDIAPRRGWDAGSNVTRPEPVRCADIYVFSLHQAKERATANVLDVGEWIFHVIGAGDLTRAFGKQKSVTLSRIQAMTPGCKYEALANAVDGLIVN